MGNKCPTCHSNNPDTSQFCGTCASRLTQAGPPPASLTKTLETPIQILKQGTLIAGKYRVLEELGRGGMGIVYKAEDTKLQRPVALKFLPHQWVSDPDARERFTQEARAASALDHPNICTIHEIEETDDGRLYIAMGCYEGESLRERIKRGPLETDKAIDLAIQAASGMAKAHAKGIVHRDLKPANILVTQDGVAKVVDFGLAKLAGQVKLTREGTTVGTVAYMSPEQAKGEAVDQRTDIWSLGVVLYEMLSGILPFKGDHEQSLIHSILKHEPERLTKFREDLPSGLENIVFKALSKKSSARYQTMEEMLGELKAIADGLRPASGASLFLRGRVLGLKKTYAYPALAGLVIAATLAALFVFPKRAVQPEKSIAVLPFINNSPDQENTYFINGVMEEILGSLQKIKTLRVISRTSVEQYRERKKSVREIAEELGVNYIVEGSAQKYGKSFRLRAQLIMAEHETHLWGESFQQEITDVEDIFNIQIRIAKSIAEELRAVISPEEKKLIEKIPAADIEVYDDYLKGLYFLEDADKESLMKAVGYLNRAVKNNPSWAPLYTGLTMVWASIAQMGFEAPEVAGPKIFENLNKALELDPDNSDTRFMSGEMAFLQEWDWEKSEKELLKALAINPSNAIARVIYAQLLSSLQRPGEALMQANMAIDLDPKNPMLQIQYAVVILGVGDCQNALIQIEKVLADDPGHFLANACILSAAFRCKEYNKVIKADRYILPVINFKEDDIKEFERIFNEQGFIKAYENVMKHLEKFAENNFISPLDMALRYIMANKPDKAMDWIEKGYEIHDPGMPYISTHCFNADPLFENPRFIAIVKKMNLPLPK
jgi:serine/threonine protein kinase